ncbi:hypothetical protein QBC38DRAFT_372731, partial [Podospora fimiseda]
LNICLSSRHYPTISIPNCPEITVESSNRKDINRYLQQRLTAAASRVFLWAILAIDIVVRELDAGQSLMSIMGSLKHVPKRMEDMYAELCHSLKPEERAFSTALMQWVLFAERDSGTLLNVICRCTRLSSH